VYNRIAKVSIPVVLNKRDQGKAEIGVASTAETITGVRDGNPGYSSRSEQFLNNVGFPFQPFSEANLVLHTLDMEGFHVQRTTMSLGIIAQISDFRHVDPQDPRAHYIGGKCVLTGDIHVLAAGSPQQRVRSPLQDVRPVDDGKVALHSLVQQVYQMIEPVRGVKLRLRSRAQAPLEILKAQGHQSQTMGLQDGYIDQKVSLKSSLGNLDVHTPKVHLPKGPLVEIDEPHTEFPGQLVNLGALIGLERAKAQHLNGSLGDRDVTATPLHQQFDKRLQDGRGCGHAVWWEIEAHR